MTQEERFFAVLDGKTPDKAPWFADMGYYYHYLAKTGQLQDEWTGESGYFNLCRELGCGIMYYGLHPYAVIQEGNVVTGAQTDGDTVTHTIATPVGTLTSCELYSRESYSQGVTKHFVETIDDLRVMCYIHEHRRYESAYAPIARVRELLRGDGFIINLPPICVAPLQKLTSRWAGIENVVSFAYDEQEEFEELMERIAASENDCYDIVGGCPERYVEFCDNLSSEVTGKYFFEKYNKPVYQRINRRLHAAGKKTGIHIDGTLVPCLSLLPGCGFDLAEAVTPAPVGDIELSRLREAVGEEFILMGGLPGALFSRQYSEEFFDQYLQKLSPYCRPGCKFIAGVADQVPPDGLPGRVRKVRGMIDGLSA